MNEVSEEVIDESRARQLALSVARRAPLDAAVLLSRESNAMISEVLNRLDPSLGVRVLAALPEKLKDSLVNLEDRVSPWQQALNYPVGTVGRLMEPIDVTLDAGMSIAEAIEVVRPHAMEAQLVYAYVIDAEGKLTGVVTMRDLLFAPEGSTVDQIMVREPFFFEVTSFQEDATRAVIQRHYPAYPVCDEDRRLLGVLRGYALFEQQTVALSAQAGSMVGIEKEERIGTSLARSVRLRHPWLQLNLLTAFAAGAVVGLFEDTIAQVVTLAAFLPVLAGQAGNTGCQALAVTLRAMTLNELKPGMEGGVLRKECLLGLSNGLMVGVTAGLAMLAYAMTTGSADAVMLSVIVVIAMLGSCMAAGVSGVLVPLTLRKFGADPATASTIFLTTATDVISMGALLGLASILIL